MKALKFNLAIRRRCFTGEHFILVLHMTVCFICFVTAASVKPPGETTPDIDMKIGANANISCHITEGNSSNIWFSEEEIGKRIEQPNRDILVLDAHTAILRINNALEHMGRYQCMIGDNAIGITKVYVGKPPIEVTDFSCKNYDFDFMTCIFKKPENMINTNYELNFSANLDKYSDRCILHTADDIIYTCNITSNSHPTLISRKMFYFNLTGTNSLGSRSQLFPINNYKSVVPAKLDIEITNVTSSSITIFWQIKKFLFYPKNCFEYKISLKPKGFESYNFIDFDHCKSKNCSVTITNLKYPYREYIFSIQSKVQEAVGNEEMWSEPYNGTFKTQPRRPDRPPKTTVGSFYIDSIEKHLRLYWQQLEEHEENGPGFYYVVKEKDMEGNTINANVSYKSSIDFAWNSGNKYKYEIRACNSHGQSERSSVIEVYPTRAGEYAPHSIATVYHNRTYTLSWKPPINQSQLVNYTVFWCLSKMESPNQCKGTIKFKYLDKGVTNFTTKPQDHELNLAISANFINAFTGMHWARCSADISSDLMKLVPEASSLSATTIRVQWSSERVCPSILQGFNLSYCQVLENSTSADQFNRDCVSQKITVVLLRGKMHDKNFTIENLIPFTKYRIEMLMYSETKVGPISDALYVQTLEAAPSAPRNLQLSKDSLTSDSAKIFWLPPFRNNGLLQYFTIWKIRNKTAEHMDSEKVFINGSGNADKMQQPIYFEMKHLHKFADYEVYVTAHTKNISEKSNSIYFKTLIGMPSIPRNVTLFGDKEFGFLKWEVPEMPSGRLEYYEVVVVEQKNIDNSLNDEREQSYLVKENFCKFKLPSCINYHLKVRAVNIVEKDEFDPSTKTQQRLFRRHTNPEISGNVGGMVQSLERPYAMKDPLTTTQLPMESEYTDDIRYDSLTYNEFKCLDAEAVNEKFYHQSKEFISKPSSWVESPYKFMRCTEYPLNNVVKMALFMFLISAFLASVSYWLRKKYNKMKNIDAVLPEELVDHLPNYQLRYNGAEKESQFDVSRSNDCLVNQKESYHLLTTICKGSSNGISSLTQTKVEEPMHTQIREQTPNLEPLDVTCKREKTFKHIDSVEMNDIPSTLPNYSTQGKKTESQEVNTVQKNPIHISSGYINPVNLRISQPPNLVDAEGVCSNVNILTSNGYVQHNGLNLMSTQQPSFNGYTTLDAMGKPIYPAPSLGSSQPVSATIPQTSREQSNESVQVIIKEPDVENIPIGSPPPNVANNNNNIIICGYVTQRQLAEFGQLLH